MSTVLLSLGLGLAFVVVANFLLARRMGGARAAATVTFLVLLIYVPYALVAWPGADIFAIHLALYLVVNLGFAMLYGSQGNRRGAAWGPAVIIGFFLVVAAANTIFLLVSEQGFSSDLARLLLPEPRSPVGSVTSRFPGTMVPGFDARRRLYEGHVEQLQEQGARGWAVRKGWLDAPVAGQMARFQVVLSDIDGHPIGGAHIAGDFLRPSNVSADQSFSMREMRSGVYLAEVTLPDPGTWSLWLRVRAEGSSHELRGTTTVGSLGRDSEPRGS